MALHVLMCKQALLQWVSVLFRHPNVTRVQITSEERKGHVMMFWLPKHDKAKLKTARIEYHVRSSTGLFLSAPQVFRHLGKRQSQTIRTIKVDHHQGRKRVPTLLLLAEAGRLSLGSKGI